MTASTLTPVGPVSPSVREVRHNQGGGGQRRRQQRPRPQARVRLLAAALPGRDPDSCEVSFELDAQGGLEEVVVRDRDTGQVLRRLTLAELASVCEATDQRGIFFERSG